MIAELFPDRRTPPHSEAPKQASDWDSPEKPMSSAGSAAAPRVDCIRSAVSAPPLPATVVEGKAPARTKERSTFDDSSDDDERATGTLVSSSGKAYAPQQGEGASNPRTNTRRASLSSHLHTVPFPAVGDASIVGACHQRCTVTTSSNPSLHHPSIDELQSLHEAIDIHTPTQLVMRRKGAFHAYAKADVGNGAAHPGCPHILCKHCDHPVVRLGGASWNDDSGRRDLYLAVRNYYPDWHRLATQHASQNGGVTNGIPLLLRDADAAAYCCQCSWLTVHGQSTHATGSNSTSSGSGDGHSSNLGDGIYTMITTPIDIVTFRSTAGTSSSEHTLSSTPMFITHVPCPAASHDAKRRPPLWECRGHSVM